MPKTMRDVIAEANQRAVKIQNDTQWGDRHRAAWDMPTVKEGQGSAIVMFIKALAKYADAHRERFESSIGEDYVLGEAWSQIAQGTLALLNGELGRLDAGTLDSMIRNMMAASGVNPDTGDPGYEPEEQGFA